MKVNILKFLFFLFLAREIVKFTRKKKKKKVHIKNKLLLLTV